MDQKSTFLVEVLRALRAAGHKELTTIAQRSGVPEGTVRKLFYGEVKNPRVQTVQALHDYFAQAASSESNHVQPSA